MFKLFKRKKDEESFLILLIILAKVDYEFHNEEINFIYKISKKLNFDEKYTKDIINNRIKGIQIEDIIKDLPGYGIEKPKKTEDRYKFLNYMAELIKIDDNINVNEIAFFYSFAEYYDFTREETYEILKRNGIA